MRAMAIADVCDGVPVYDLGAAPVETETACEGTRGEAVSEGAETGGHESTQDTSGSGGGPYVARSQRLR